MTIFKNNAERKKFLDNCESWELYHDVPPLKLKIFIAQLSDSAKILAYVYENPYLDYNVKVYQLFQPNINTDELYFSQHFDSVPRVMEYIRTNKLGSIESGDE